MVASVARLKSAGQAADYYREIDDYYRGTELSPTAWYGKGAEALGLSGEVDSKTFTRMLEGKLPDGTQLGKADGQGGKEHAPGWDITFSAPKGGSALALVGDDQRVTEAHDRAVRIALNYVERHAATGRNKVLEKAGGKLTTDNLLIATFRHTSNRENGGQPHLHTHCVIANATHDAEGTWRSLESHAILKIQTEAGELYRQEFARELRAAGYELDTYRDREGRFMFDVRGVDKDLCKEWSKGSARVEKNIESKGLTRQTASGAQKSVAALKNRPTKSAHLSDAEKGMAWKEQAAAFGADLPALAAAAQANAPTLATYLATGRDAADSAVVDAARHLAEKNARFTGKDLEIVARRFANGNSSQAEICAAIERAEQRGDLVGREARGYDVRTGRNSEFDGFTTRESIQTEREMLSLADAGTYHPSESAPEHEFSTEEKEQEHGIDRYDGNADEFDKFSSEQIRAATRALPASLREPGFGLDAQGRAASTLAGVRNLSSVDLVSNAKGAESLLSTHESHHLGQVRTTNPEMRRQGAGNSAISGDAGAGLTRDARLAREALATYGREPHANLAKLKSAGATRQTDSAGRVYYSLAGKTYAASLYAKRTETSHLLKKFIVVDRKITLFGRKFNDPLGRKVVLKDKGNLTSWAAGKVRDRLQEKISKTDSRYAKAVLKPWADLSRKAQGWRKAGTIEGIVARVKMSLESRTARADELARLREQAQARPEPARRLQRETANEVSRQADRQPLASGERNAEQIKIGDQIGTTAEARAAIARQESKTGFDFNPAQRKAAEGIMTSPDRVHLVQGFAGTAKTTSVLAATADELRRQGYDVKALAPTSSAKNTLGEAIGEKGETVAAHLLSREPGGMRQVWIVDEAGMLSAKDMRALLAKAEEQNARVILVGDVKQLASVEAGNAFKQLQERTSAKTYVLDEIVRQTDKHALAAVQASIKGDARDALNNIERCGSVQEIAKPVERRAALVRDYMAQTPQERAKSLVVTQTRAEREQINSAIRAEMKAKGELAGPSWDAKTLEKRDLSKTEASKASSYREGDLIRIGKDYRSLDLKKGEYVTVKSADLERGRIVVEKANGKQVELAPAKTKNLEAFSETKREMQAGDRIAITRNDKDAGRFNGQQLVVQRVEEGKIHCRDARTGKAIVLDPAKNQNDRHFDHAYCSTAHAAQGRTCDRVFALMSSTRTNLTSLQAFYVQISRAKEAIRMYVDSKEKLAQALERETGEKATALREPDREQQIQAEKSVERERGVPEKNELRGAESDRPGRAGEKMSAPQHLYIREGKTPEAEKTNERHEPKKEQKHEHTYERER